MKIDYNPEITLGNILQVVTIGAGVLSAYIAITNRLVDHDARIQQTEARVQELRMENEKQDRAVLDTNQRVERKLDKLNDTLTAYIIDRALKDQKK